MHWCADETQAVINTLSSIDFVWLWFRSMLGQLVGRAFRRGAPAGRSAPCDCHHDQS